MNGSNKSLVIFNTITLAVMLFVNYASNAGVFSNVTVGDISHKYDTLFAPAGYAFIIWSLIFLAWIAFVIHQWILLRNGDPRSFISRTGIWYSVSNILNGLWVYGWVNEWIGLSVLLILGLLLTLSIMTIKLRLELDDEPVRTIFFVWWPVVFYLGWMMVATIACISAWLISINWHGGPISESAWTIIMIAVASLIYLYLVKSRNLREAATVGIWAFVAIAVRQWDAHRDIAISAIVASAILFIIIGVHGYKHRNYAVGTKLKRGEWK